MQFIAISLLGMLWKKKPRGTCVEHTKVVKILFASLLIWKSSEISHYICFYTALHVTAGFY